MPSCFQYHWHYQYHPKDRRGCSCSSRVSDHKTYWVLSTDVCGWSGPGAASSGRREGVERGFLRIILVQGHDLGPDGQARGAQQIILEFLASNSRIPVIGEPSASKELRMPVVSFVVQGVDSPRPVDEVERRSAFWFRNGHMYSYSYSHRLLADVCRLDNVKDGVVRVSILHYNTEAELTPYMRFNLKTDFEKSHSLTSPDSRLLLCLAASTTALYRQATSVVLPVHGPLGALI
ncbi:hypothetical protein CBS147332_4774 [Penicillium roqueforti]|nr:hypothetical protein CBS147332_4774 [Penicillium roqueforti]KAI3114228.1 hypothetical protein CBS147331_4040 [Penicillium roqueforti]